MLPEIPATPRQRTNLTLGIIGVCVLLGGIFIGRYVLPANGSGISAPFHFVTVEEGKHQLIFPTFWEAWDQLHQKFDGKIDDQTLYYGAVSGMIRAAGDAYTTFADPDETQQFEDNIEGSFSGIGVEIGMRSGLLTVIAPLSGSPAEQAGIREGDIIVGINKKPLTQETTIDEAVKEIRGPRGSKVSLTVLHKDSRETADIEITRDKIEIESVKLEMKDNIAHITITNFNSDTTNRFNIIARQVAQAEAHGIILDVRNNPGGFLQTAVEIASRFIPKGAVVVSERGKETTEYKAEGNQLFLDVPTVVLINGGSASASEILAGALKDQLKTPLIGDKTFGKGSVQEFIKLKDGSSLRVTVAKWFTPSGHNIHEQGIEADIKVEQDPDTEADEQLDRAREELQKIIK